MGLLDRLSRHQPEGADEAAHLATIRAFVTAHPDPFDRRIPHGHLTASAFVFSAGRPARAVAAPPQAGPLAAARRPRRGRRERGRRGRALREARGGDGHRRRSPAPGRAAPAGRRRPRHPGPRPRAGAPPSGPALRRDRTGWRRAHGRRKRPTRCAGSDGTSLPALVWTHGLRRGLAKARRFFHLGTDLASAFITDLGGRTTDMRHRTAACLAAVAMGAPTGAPRGAAGAPSHASGPTSTWST